MPSPGPSPLRRCLFCWERAGTVALAEAQSNPARAIRADQGAPTVTITGETIIQQRSFWVTITFSEAVTGFQQGDITVGNGSVVTFSGSGADYRAKIRSTAGGTVTVDVPGNVATNAANRGNVAASQFSIETDIERPKVSITGPASVRTGPFDVTITFSEPVTDFEKGDVTVSNGTVTAFSGSSAGYTATIDPGASGTVTVNVAAHVAKDVARNPNLPASQYSVQANLNAAPVITAPGGKTYQQGQEITAFGITTTDADGDEVTVTISGLPSGLSYSSGQVQGTVSASATAQDYTVTISADDGVNTAVTATFTITVTAAASTPPANSSPVITAPGGKMYQQGQEITAFGITTTDADGDEVTVTISGLPSGLSYSSGQVQGTVSASATAQDYTVTISADDGVNTAVTATFTITVTEPNQPPVIGDSFAAYCIQDQAVWPFSIDVSDPDGDAVTVTVENLPPGLSYSDGKVRGTPMANEPMIQAGTDRLYNVTVKADDGVNPVVTRVFNYSVLYGRPRITVPANKTYQQGEEIEAFAITVDADERYKTVDVTGLPLGLSYASGQVTGTVSEKAEAEAYTVTITADGDGPKGFTPTTATFTITVTEAARPTVSITGPKGMQKVSFWVTITFSEAVTEFEQGDLAIGNGSVVTFTGEQASYRAKIRAATNGTVTVDVAGNVARNEKGIGNTAASRFSAESDRDRPTLTISGPHGLLPADAEMPMAFRFSEPVTGFELGDITVSNGSAKDFSGSGAEYWAYISPDSTGRVTIDVAVDAATDAAGNGNKATQFRRLVDLDRPTATFKGPAVVDGSSQVEVSLRWSEPVVGFSASRIVVGGGRLNILRAANSKGTLYTLKVGAWNHGTVTLDIPRSVCMDLRGNGNDAASFSMEVDMKPPTVSIAGPTDPQNGPFDATITFSEAVTGFEQGDVAVGNGTVTAFSGSGAGYTATVTPMSSGTVTVDVPAGVARDSAGHDNGAASQFSVLADLIRPTVTIAGPATAQNSDFDVTITFSKSVTGFTQGDVNVGNGAVTTFSGSGASYTATIAPTASGTVTVDVPANIATDADNDGNTAASQYSVDADLDPPTVTISGPTDKQTRPFAVNITFSEPVTSFEQSDVTVGNGALTTFSGSGATYTATVAPKVNGTVTVDMASAVAVDVAGNGNVSASRYSVEADLTKQSVTLSRPAVTLSGPTETQNGPFDVSINFLRKAPSVALLPEPVSVTGFEKDDVTVGNGSITAFSGSGAQYTATISPAATGIVTVEVPANMAVDAANNGNDASNRISVLADLRVPITAPSVSIDDASADEGDPITFTVTLDKPVPGGLTVTPNFTDGRAIDGSDYTPSTATLSFAGTAGETQAIVVATNEDSLVESDETFTVFLSVSGTTQPVASTDTATGTIIDDDAVGGTVFVSIHDPEDPVTEGSGVALPVRFTASVDGTVQVPWTTSGSAPASSAGRASKISANVQPSRHEHEPGSGTVTFQAGQTEATIQIRILDNEVHEDQGSFGVTLGEPSVDAAASRRVSVDRRTATVTILDNDAPPVFDEGDAATRSVAENSPPGSDIGAPIMATDAENDPLDYTLGGSNASAFALDPATGQLRTKAPLDFEVKNTFDKLTVTVDDGHGHTDILSLTVHVIDVSPPDAPDAPTVANSSIDPAGSLDVTWRTPAQNGAPITEYDVRHKETGATSWRDHAFGGASTSTTITGLTAASTYEVQVRARNSEGASEWSDSGRGTTLDPSVLRETVTIGGASSGNGGASCEEGDAMTFVVTLNRTVQGGLALTPVFSDVTATAGIDYTANESPLRFSGTAGETRTFTVATTEDDAIEENETFTVSLRASNAPSGVTVGNPATGTIIDDDGENEPPGFDAGQGATRAVAENTPAGGPVGDPIAATDPNGDRLSYALSGSDAFAIDAGTGQITVSAGASLNYEAGPLSYAVTVTVNDGRDGNDVIEVVISVTDAAEPPAAPAAPKVTGASLTSVQLAWRAPANTGPAVNDYDVRYRKQSATDWTSHAFTGTKTVATIPGLESNATYEAQVRARNAEGVGGWSPSGTGQTRVNTAPMALDDVVTVFRGRMTASLWTGNGGHDSRTPLAPSSNDFEIPEPDVSAKIAPLSSTVSATESDDESISVLANDVDAEDTRSQLTAILVDPPSHGELTLFENGTFAYAHNGSRVAEDRFTYRVEDSRGASSNPATVTVIVTGVNLGPAVNGTIPDQVLTMGENGTVDLTGRFTDPDGDPLKYEASSSNGIVNVSLVGKMIALTPLAVATTRVTVTARDPYGLSAKLSFAVTVENLQSNRARFLELSLAAFGRTVLSQAVDAIVGRFEATSRAMRATLDGSRLGLGQAFNAVDWVHVAAGLLGIPLKAPAYMPSVDTTASAGLPEVTSDPSADRPILSAPSGRSVLTRSSFQMAMDRSGSGENGWTLWGRGTGSRYSGDSFSDSRMDGSVTAAYIGADYHWGSKFVMGLSASYSNGAQDFDNAGNGTGKWKTRLTSLHPYVYWSPTGKLGLWGMLGFGRGDAELNSGHGGPLAGTGSSSIETDISSRSAALGGRMDLTRLGNVDLALTADAFAVSTASETVAGLSGTSGDAQRVRMMVNGSTDWSVTPDTRMDLSLAMGARVDGGDADTGLGTELAGALSLANRRMGLDLEVRSHWLVAHQDRNFKEGGLSLALRLDPGSDNKGLALFLEPSWGKNAGAGADALWKGERMMAFRHGTDGQEDLDWRPNRARAALGYGMETWGGRGRLEPFVELDVEDAGLRRLGGGLRLGVPGASNGSAAALTNDLRLELLGEYRLPRQVSVTGESAARVGTPDYRVGFSVSRNF